MLYEPSAKNSGNSCEEAIKMEYASCRGGNRLDSDFFHFAMAHHGLPCERKSFGSFPRTVIVADIGDNVFSPHDISWTRRSFPRNVIVHGGI